MGGYDGLFAHPKMQRGAGREMHPRPCAVITRRKPKRLIHVLLRFFCTTIITWPGRCVRV